MSCRSATSWKSAMRPSWRRHSSAPWKYGGKCLGATLGSRISSTRSSKLLGASAGAVEEVEEVEEEEEEEEEEAAREEGELVCKEAEMAGDGTVGQNSLVLRHPIIYFPTSSGVSE